MSEEQVIFMCHTGVAFGGEPFSPQEKVTMHDLMPAVHELMSKCDGVIMKPGIYSFELKVIKIK